MEHGQPAEVPCRRDGTRAAGGVVWAARLSRLGRGGVREKRERPRGENRQICPKPKGWGGFIAVGGHLPRVRSAPHYGLAGCSPHKTAPLPHDSSHFPMGSYLLSYKTA